MPRNTDDREVDTSRLSPISYYYAHRKVKRARGRALDHACTGCGHQASQWAYQGGSEYEQKAPVKTVLRGVETWPVLVWSADVFSYAPMCVPCHRALDTRKEDTNE